MTSSASSSRPVSMSLLVSVAPASRVSIGSIRGRLEGGLTTLFPAAPYDLQQRGAMRRDLNCQHGVISRLIGGELEEGKCLLPSFDDSDSRMRRCEIRCGAKGSIGDAGSKG